MTTEPVRGRYAAQVIADLSGKWCGNALWFGTVDPAENYVRDLAERWSAVRPAVLQCLRARVGPSVPAAPERRDVVDLRPWTLRGE
jgi:hypothetical protein